MSYDLDFVALAKLYQIGLGEISVLGYQSITMRWNSD